MRTQRHILIVEDDSALRQIVADHLTDDGSFTTVGAGSLDEASDSLDAEGAHFDAMILDIGLPDGNGCDFCMRLRRLGHTMPIIMLTGWDSESDIVRGLDCGANDYMAKPIRSRELLARLRTQLRLSDSSEAAVYSVGPYSFQPSKKLLRNPDQNRNIRLTEKETAVLKFLCRANAHTGDRQDLLREVWSYNAGVNSHTLETHIYRLRQKMEPSPDNPALLVTTSGGYRLNP